MKSEKAKETKVVGNQMAKERVVMSLSELVSESGFKL